MKPLSYRSQPIDLQSKSMDWFLYDNGLRHERVKRSWEFARSSALFSNTGITLTTDGQRHLGVEIGTSNFRAQYAAVKVTKWCNELHRLADFAKTQAHAAYSAFTHRILSQYTYFMGTIPSMHEFIKPVDDRI